MQLCVWPQCRVWQVDKRQELFKTEVSRKIGMIQKNLAPMAEKEDCQPYLKDWRPCKARLLGTQSGDRSLGQCGERGGGVVIKSVDRKRRVTAVPLIKLVQPWRPNWSVCVLTGILDLVFHTCVCRISTAVLTQWWRNSGAVTMGDIHRE